MAKEASTFGVGEKKLRQQQNRAARHSERKTREGGSRELVTKRKGPDVTDVTFLPGYKDNLNVFDKGKTNIKLLRKLSP